MHWSYKLDWNREMEAFMQRQMVIAVLDEKPNEI